jgi:hypothetical protein
VHTEFRWGNLRERDHLEPVVIWRIILRWIFREWNEGMDRIYLAEDRDRWQAVVNENEPAGCIKCWEFLE